MTAEFKYPAFISYSHSDEKWAKWLHTALESYRVPKRLVGALGKDGAIPKKIFPIYRDRDEFAAAADLDEHIKSSLERSANLIVICSPAAARSRWVNDEIVAFKKLGRDERILALVVDGEPNASVTSGMDSDRECFPEALRSRLKPDGQPTSKRVEPAAADARSQADGKENAKLKLIAGLLGVNYDDLKQRELEASKRRGRVYQGIAAGMLLLALLATAGGFLAYHFALQSEAMAEDAVAIAAKFVNRTVKLSNQFGITQSTIDGFLVDADRELAQLYERGVRTPNLERQHARILMLFAQYYEATGDTSRARDRAISALKLLDDLVRQKLTVLDDQAALANAEGDFGDVLLAQGNYRVARDSYQDSLRTYQKLQQLQPKQSQWRRLIARRLSDVGWTYEKDGDLGKALRAYESAMGLRKVLAVTARNNLQLQHDLFASQQNIGAILKKQGRLSEALRNFQDGERVARRIASADVRNTEWRIADANMDLSVGDVLAAQGRVPEALIAYHDAFEIREKLAVSDPSNAEWQYATSAVQIHMGDALSLQGSRGAALSMYSQAIVTLNRLVSLDSKNTDWLRDLYVSKRGIGDALKSKGDLSGALASYRDALLRAKQLSATDPSNDAWRDDQATFNCDVGDVLALEGQVSSALASYRAADRLLQHLTKDYLATEEVQMDVAHVDEGIGEVAMRSRDYAAAWLWFSNALRIRESWLATDDSNAALLHDVALSEFRLAVAEDQLKLKVQSRAHIREALSRFRAVLTIVPSQPDWTSELVSMKQFQMSGKITSLQCDCQVPVYMVNMNPSDAQPRVSSVDYRKLE